MSPKSRRNDEGTVKCYDCVNGMVCYGLITLPCVVCNGTGKVAR